jgi:ubiquinone/menaquinone biosynthesis methyltransferase
MENLKTSFGKSKVRQSQKTKMVQDVFTEVTEKYDLMNNLMSFGAHRIWKKKLIQLMNIQSNDYIIDVGSGTGDITNLIHKIHSAASIISIDLNFNMLKYGKEKENYISNNIFWINCNAENLPFNNNTFDKYIISFCLRNITLVDNALQEARRVLKPGGSFYCLEFSTPVSPFINGIYNFYKSKIIPLIGEQVANNKEAYKYLEESISEFPNQNILLSKINQIGFENTSVINFFNGIVSIHKGFKI